jgi:hypothetical protein
MRASWTEMFNASERASIEKSEEFEPEGAGVQASMTGSHQTSTASALFHNRSLRHAVMSGLRWKESKCVRRQRQSERPGFLCPSIVQRLNAAALRDFLKSAGQGKPAEITPTEHPQFELLQGALRGESPPAPVP